MHLCNKPCPRSLATALYRALNSRKLYRINLGQRRPYSIRLSPTIPSLAPRAFEVDKSRRDQIVIFQSIYGSSPLDNVCCLTAVRCQLSLPGWSPRLLRCTLSMGGLHMHALPLPEVAKMPGGLPPMPSGVVAGRLDRPEDPRTEVGGDKRSSEVVGRPFPNASRGEHVMT